MTFPVVIAVIGAVLFLVGLLGVVRSERLQFEMSRGPRCAAIITGVLLITISGLAFYASVIATSPNGGMTSDGRVVAMLQTVFPSYSTRPDALLTLIRERQREYVRESTGEEEGQCFTSDDLEEFQRSGITHTVIQALRQDNRFINIVRNIKKLEPVARQDLLVAARNIAKPTWAQLGKISSKGQTVAGRQAELLIAETVSSFVEELMQQSDEELVKMYR